MYFITQQMKTASKNYTECLKTQQQTFFKTSYTKSFAKLYFLVLTLFMVTQLANNLRTYRVLHFFKDGTSDTFFVNFNT